MTKEQLDFLQKLKKEYRIGNYIIVNDKVNVDGNVNLSEMNLDQIPVKFGKITGSFNCWGNKLTTFNNMPDTVGNGFLCTRNKFTEKEFSKIFNIKIGVDIICDEKFDNVKKLYYNMRNISNAK